MLYKGLADVFYVLAQTCPRNNDRVDWQQGCEGIDGEAEQLDHRPSTILHDRSDYRRQSYGLLPLWYVHSFEKRPKILGKKTSIGD